MFVSPLNEIKTSQAWLLEILSLNFWHDNNAFFTTISTRSPLGGKLSYPSGSDHQQIFNIVVSAIFQTQGKAILQFLPFRFSEHGDRTNLFLFSRFSILRQSNKHANRIETRNAVLLIWTYVDIKRLWLQWALGAGLADQSWLVVKGGPSFSCACLLVLKLLPPEARLRREICLGWLWFKWWRY